MTFVLGLVAEPPSPKYVYSPSEREEALIKGRVVLEKYNCGGCHVLDAERWDIAYYLIISANSERRLVIPVSPQFSIEQLQRARNGSTRQFAFHVTRTACH
ncbi:MAG: hypothetical protein R3C99_17810 [Pirellulaceae bacterium]